MNTLLLIFLAPFLTSTAVGQVESVQTQAPFLQTAALKFYCRYGSVLNEDVSGCTPKTVVQEQPQQTVQEKVVEVVRNVFVPVASAQEPSDSYLESMIRRIVLELLPQPEVITVKGEKGDKGDRGDPGTSGSNLLAFDGIQMPFWNGYGSGPTGGGVINNYYTGTSSVSLQDAYDFGGAGLGKEIDTTMGGAVDIMVQDGPGIFNGLTITGDTNTTQGIIFGKNDFGAGQQAAFGFADDVNNPGVGGGMFANYHFGLNLFNFSLVTGSLTSHGMAMGNPAVENAGTTFENFTPTPNVISLRVFGVGGMVQNVGNGDPEGVVAADSGSVYYRLDGTTSAEQLYVKTVDATNTGWVALGASATSSSAWDLGGNAGTNPDVNFLGTTDNVDLVFKTNSATSGLIANDGLAVFFGAGAGAGASRINTNFFGQDAGSGANAAENSNFFGSGAGNGATNASYSNFFGEQAGQNAASAFNSNFFGVWAGRNATNATDANFFGTNAGNLAIDAFNSNFFSQNAGRDAISANDSNFFGMRAGQTATNASFSNFFGQDAGYQATNANNSNFFGTDSGNAAIDASDANFFGHNAGFGATLATGSNFFGQNTGNGATGASFSNFFGAIAGFQATGASNSNFFGTAAGFQATTAANSNFFGANAGESATNASGSNFFGTNAGQGATNASESNFFGTAAGLNATNADHSNFFGPSAGNGATNADASNFFGDNAGFNATNAANSIFVGTNAGNAATNANNSIFIGTNAGFVDGVNNSLGGTSILIGRNTSTGGFSDSIALGEGAVNTAANQLYIRDAITNFNLAGVSYFFPTAQGATGTTLVNDGTGILTWANVATSAIVTADNGLTVNPVNNVQLGGRLLQNTSIEINDGFGGFLFEVGPNAGEPLFKVDNGTQTASLGDDNGWSTGTVIEADVQNNQLRFSTNLLERMRIDASGNVGIGTTTLSERLQVNGNLRLDGAFMPNNNAGLLGEVLVSQGSGLAPVWTPNTPSNIYTTSGILNSDRDVSLNGYYLQIADAATDTLFYIDDSTVAFLSDNAGETALVDVISTGAGAEVRMELQGTNPAEFQLDNQSGVARGTFSSSGGYGIQYLGFGESNQDNTLNDANYGTLQNNSLVPRSYVDGLFAQNIIQNGNSFGTTTIIGTNDLQNFSFETNNTQRANFRADNAFGLELFNLDTTNRYAYAIRNATNNLNYSLWDGATQDWLLGFNDNQFLVIDRTDNRDMMRITKSGGVYNTAIGDATTASGNTISFLNNNAGYTNTAIGINSSRKFFITDGATVRFWVKPSNVLSTDTTNYESFVLADNDIPNRRFVFNNFFAQNGNAFGGLATMGTTDSNDVRIVASSTEAMRILTTGNILANTIMPNGPYGSNVSNYDLGSTTARWREVWTNIVNVGGASTWSLVNNATRLDFSAGASGSGAERVTFLTGGEVGIGNTSPTDRLHVGNASGPSVRISVDSATQAGLVFREGGVARWSFIHGDFGNGTFGLLNHFNGSYALTVSSTSNIGLSNNNPLFILHTGSSSIISGTTVARFENGGGTCDVTPNVAGGITCTSDQNLKKDIESIDPIDSLQKLLAVEVKSYRMNADTSTSTKQTGFLAQQLETQFPGLVLTSIEGTKSVSYAGMTPILTQAIQTLYRFMSDIGVTIEGGVAKVGEFVANKVKTDELCVGSVCVTESQFLQMVQSAQVVSDTETVESSNNVAFENNDGSEPTTPVASDITVNEDQVDENNTPISSETPLDIEVSTFDVEPVTETVSDTVASTDLIE